MNHNARINTLKALVIGSSSIHINEKAIISNEYDEVSSAGKVRIKNRGFLLQVLHSTRALDSLLRSFTLTRNCGTGKSIGQHLSNLTNHTNPSVGNLSEPSRRRYQTNIADKRNRFLHEAGAFPISDLEIESLLSEMESCVAQVLSL